MAKFVPPDLYGVIGHPIGHSLSPLLHGRAFASLGILGVLLPWDVAPESLPAFVAAARLLGVRGFCVTIPHKQAILGLVDKVDGRAAKVRAANLVYRDGDLLRADNTDVPGFTAPLLEFRLPTSTRVLVLGAGGVARAAAAGLLELGLTRIDVTSVSGRSAVALAADFGLRAVPWAERGEAGTDLVVNTTPLGMTGAHVAETPYPAEFLARRTGLVYDLVYTPRVTRLLAEAGAAGWRTLGGLDMFVAQADRQFRVWTGRGLPPEARQWVEEALGEREG